jgi:hypothetical protein
MQRVMRILLASVALAVVVAAPASAAAPDLQTWHRLSPGPAPEHERLQCLPGVEWVCRYDKVPEPQLGFQWDRTKGMFHGSDVTSSWACPDWFPTEICSGTAQVIGGVIDFSVAGGGAFRTGYELVFTDGSGIAPLYVYWPDVGFVCPWYGSLADAIAANPDASPDCVFAP